MEFYFLILLVGFIYIWLVSRRSKDLDQRLQRMEFMVKSLQHQVQDQDVNGHQRRC